MLRAGFDDLEREVLPRLGNVVPSTVRNAMRGGARASWDPASAHKLSRRLRHRVDDDDEQRGSPFSPASKGELGWDLSPGRGRAQTAMAGSRRLRPMDGIRADWAHPSQAREARDAAGGTERGTTAVVSAMPSQLDMAQALEETEAALRGAGFALDGVGAGSADDGDELGAPLPPPRSDAPRQDGGGGGGSGGGGRGAIPRAFAGAGGAAFAAGGAPRLARRGSAGDLGLGSLARRSSDPMLGRAPGRGGGRGGGGRGGGAAMPQLTSDFFKAALGKVAAEASRAATAESKRKAEHANKKLASVTAGLASTLSRYDREVLALSRQARVGFITGEEEWSDEDQDVTLPPDDALSALAVAVAMEHDDPESDEAVLAALAASAIDPQLRGTNWDPLELAEQRFERERGARRRAVMTVVDAHSERAKVRGESEDALAELVHTRLTAAAREGGRDGMGGLVDWEKAGADKAERNEAHLETVAQQMDAVRALVVELTRSSERDKRRAADRARTLHMRMLELLRAAVREQILSEVDVHRAHTLAAELDGARRLAAKLKVALRHETAAHEATAALRDNLREQLQALLTSQAASADASASAAVEAARAALEQARIDHEAALFAAAQARDAGAPASDFGAGPPSDVLAEADAAAEAMVADLKDQLATARRRYAELHNTLTRSAADVAAAMVAAASATADGSAYGAVRDRTLLREARTEAWQALGRHGIEREMIAGLLDEEASVMALNDAHAEAQAQRERAERLEALVLQEQQETHEARRAEAELRERLSKLAHGAGGALAGTPAEEEVRAAVGEPAAEEVRTAVGAPGRSSKSLRTSALAKAQVRAAALELSLVQAGVAERLLAAELAAAEGQQAEGMVALAGRRQAVGGAAAATGAAAAELAALSGGAESESEAADEQAGQPPGSSLATSAERLLSPADNQRSSVGARNSGAGSGSGKAARRTKAAAEPTPKRGTGKARLKEAGKKTSTQLALKQALAPQPSPPARPSPKAARRTHAPTSPPPLATPPPPALALSAAAQPPAATPREPSGQPPAAGLPAAVLQAAAESLEPALAAAVGALGAELGARLDELRVRLQLAVARGKKVLALRNLARSRSTSLVAASANSLAAAAAAAQHAKRSAVPEVSIVESEGEEGEEEAQAHGHAARADSGPRESAPSRSPAAAVLSAAAARASEALAAGAVGEDEGVARLRAAVAASVAAAADGARAGGIEAAHAMRAERARRAALVGARAKRVLALTDYALGWLQYTSARTLEATAAHRERRERRRSLERNRAAGTAGAGGAAEAERSDGSEADALSGLAMVGAAELASLEELIGSAQAHLHAMAQWAHDDAHRTNAPADGAGADEAALSTAALAAAAGAAVEAAAGAHDEEGRAAQALLHDSSRDAAASAARHEAAQSAHFDALEAGLNAAQDEALTFALRLLLGGLLPSMVQQMIQSALARSQADGSAAQEEAGSGEAESAALSEAMALAQQLGAASQQLAAVGLHPQAAAPAESEAAAGGLEKEAAAMEAVRARIRQRRQQTAAELLDDLRAMADTSEPNVAAHAGGGVLDALAALQLGGADEPPADVYVAPWAAGSAPRHDEAGSSEPRERHARAHRSKHGKTSLDALDEEPADTPQEVRRPLARTLLLRVRFAHSRIHSLTCRAPAICDSNPPHARQMASCRRAPRRMARAPGLSGAPQPLRPRLRRSLRSWRRCGRSSRPCSNSSPKRASLYARTASQRQARARPRCRGAARGRRPHRGLLVYRPLKSRPSSSARRRAPSLLSGRRRLCTCGQRPWRSAPTRWRPRRYDRCQSQHLHIASMPSSRPFPLRAPPSGRSFGASGDGGDLCERRAHFRGQRAAAGALCRARQHGRGAQHQRGRLPSTRARRRDGCARDIQQADAAKPSGCRAALLRADG